MCEITKKNDLIQNQVNFFSFDWSRWNASESEVGRSYGGHEENEFKMRRDALWSEEVSEKLRKKKLKCRRSVLHLEFWF